MTHSDDRAAFLLLFEEPVRASRPAPPEVQARTQTLTFVDQEEPDDDDALPVAGTKTVTDTREENDDDASLRGYNAIPRLHGHAASVATRAGTMTKGGSESDGQDEDEDFSPRGAIPVAGTMTFGDGDNDATDEDPDRAAEGVLPQLSHRRRAVAVSGTVTQRRGGKGGSDEDVDGLSDRPLAGTGTATKATEEQDHDEGARSFAALPVPTHIVR